MCALALNEIDSFLSSRGTKHREPHGACHLHCRAADSAARAVHQYSFRSMRLRGVVERMVRSPVWNPHARPLAKTDFFGQGMYLFFQSERVFSVGAGNGFRGIDAVARLYFLDATANRLHYSCGVRAWRIRQRRFDSISAGTHVGVVGVHAGGMDSHENLPGGRLWRGDFLELQNLGSAELMNENGFHCFSPENISVNERTPPCRCD